jgi:hypothetical protein
VSSILLVSAEMSSLLGGSCHSASSNLSAGLGRFGAASGAFKLRAVSSSGFKGGSHFIQYANILIISIKITQIFALNGIKGIPQCNVILTHQ